LLFANVQQFSVFNLLMTFQRTNRTKHNLKKIRKKKKQNNIACDGGFAPGVFENLKDMGGVALEAHYPYTGLDGWCNRNGM